MARKKNTAPVDGGERDDNHDHGGPEFDVPDGYVLMVAPCGATGGNVDGHAFDVEHGHAIVPEAIVATLLSHRYTIHAPDAE